MGPKHATQHNTIVLSIAALLNTRKLACITLLTGPEQDLHALRRGYPADQSLMNNSEHPRSFFFLPSDLRL